MSDNEISQVLQAIQNLRDDMRDGFSNAASERTRMRNEINEHYGALRDIEIRAAKCDAHFEEIDRQVEGVEGRGAKTIDRANDALTLAKNIAWIVGIIAAAVIALVKSGVVE